MSILIASVMAEETYIAEETWQKHLHEGLNYFSQRQYQEALIEFDRALNGLPEGDPISAFVLLKKAESNFFLLNYSQVLKDTEKALELGTLTDEERLVCGSKRVAVFWEMQDEDSAMKEYNKHISGSSLMAKLTYTKDKIIIRNVLKCPMFQEMTRKWLLSKYCEKEEDIYEYDQTWIINITKKEQSSGLEASSLIQQCSRLDRKRTPAEIQACCDTCGKLAAGANVLCGLLAGPELIGGPVTAAACTACCFVFVVLKQDCETCCRGEAGKCWASFETWKEDYKKQYPQCPIPPARR